MGCWLTGRIGVGRYGESLMLSARDIIGDLLGLATYCAISTVFQEYEPNSTEGYEDTLVMTTFPP